MKNILGLDLGASSIGWALIDADNNKIIKAGSRIIPMDEGEMSKYESGNLTSAAAERTTFRSARRLYERAILRRERLLRVLNVMNFLPPSFSEQIDFTEHPGKFKNHGEPLLPYKKDNDGKSEFLFTDSFNEMIEDFKKHQPQLVAGGKKVPYDWTIYYLRHKALTKAIKKEELAWILLNFNTKRGYYQLRGKDGDNSEDQPTKKEEYMPLTVVSVEDLGPDSKNSKKKGQHSYNITYDNGVTQNVSAAMPPQKEGSLVDVIVTTKLDKNGNTATDKEGKPQVSVRTPQENDWKLVKKRTEYNLEQSHGTVGSYIYNNLLACPDTKVRGQLIRTIERRFYRDELRQILEKQKEFIPELNDAALCEACLHELYHHNAGHVNMRKNSGFTTLFVDDIIFYQRPLKSKKSLIAECPFESYHYDKNGEIQVKGVKCIPKSHPLYEEFRLWQFISNLRIYKRSATVNGKLCTDVDVTGEFLKNEDDVCKLFDFLSKKKQIKQQELLKYKPWGIGKDKVQEYRWNYVDDDAKAYPCCPTNYEIVRRLEKMGIKELPEDKKQKQEPKKEEQPKQQSKQQPKQQPNQQLWHILYSVDDLVMYRKALAKFARRHGLPEDKFVEAFAACTLGSDDYGAYSEKAIRRLLPLMRQGKYWKEEDIDDTTRKRINRIIDGEADDSISDRTREKLSHLKSISDFKGLDVWEAAYAVYNRHSEAADTTRWEKPEDIDLYLQTKLKQHSLRNPVVEKVTGETLRTVRDIWKKYGRIDEVHIEMGRELKKNAESRQRETKQNQKNEIVNRRIKFLLQEFAAHPQEYGIENLRPDSPSQQEKFKIFEDGIINDPLFYTNKDETNNLSDINKLIDKPEKERAAGRSKIQRYRLWMEQNYKSPYTGQVIPLSKLFTPAYQIEHIIPQSRYFDDSFSNKVLCESEVNLEKSDRLGYQFISEEPGKIIPLSGGGKVKIFNKNQYEEFVQEHYRGNPVKMRKLLMDEIPDKFIERQMNDTRYITRRMLGILSCLVREEGEQEAVSKHVIPTTGAITARLKKDWGLNDIWNSIIAPRFERLNTMTGSSRFGHKVEKDGKRYFQTNVPLEFSKGFTKKRIDHRHHALDAIITACATRNHVNYLNNMYALSANSKERDDLKRLLCRKTRPDSGGNYTWLFKSPWEGFARDVQLELEGIVVSFKQDLRIITRTKNYFTHYVGGRKVVDRQTKGDQWAIRKSLHKDTPSGLIRLQKTKNVKLKEALENPDSIVDRQLRQTVRHLAAQNGKYDKNEILKYFKDRKYIVNGHDYSKVDIYYYTEGKEAVSANRVDISPALDISKVTDSGIRKILSAHLENYKDDNGKPNPQIAFSPEGIEEMNKNIKLLNGGKDHKPIYKARKMEDLGMKFNVGSTGAKNRKYVEADKGTNLFFAVYADDKGKRSFESIPLTQAVERMKNHLSVAETQKPDGRKLLFTLSPGDLVQTEDKNGKKHLYKMASSTGHQCFFVPHTWAALIVKGYELKSLNKVEMTIEDGTNIKNTCRKVVVDRLGQITAIYG